jgi:Kdo2-lipid IVA lauroyltransferase/acyltransferase
VSRRFAVRLKKIANAIAGRFTVWFFKAIRHTDPHRMANLAGWLMQRIGPWLPEHRIGRANLVAAFPEKTSAEIDKILSGVWDNVGRIGAEYAHLDRLWDYDWSRQQRGRMLDSEASLERACRLRDDNKPALIFSAHLANWELAAFGAAAFGIDTTVLYRRPNLGAVADALIALRGDAMGELVPTGLNAPVKIAEALERGSHVGLLVDQYYVRGVDVVFFGRTTKANPTIARLARHFECPIHGLRVIRYPGNRYQLNLTEEIAPARDADGKIDVQGTMQVITGVVEDWVREHPEQWLWLHRRWR